MVALLKTEEAEDLEKKEDCEANREDGTRKAPSSREGGRFGRRGKGGPGLRPWTAALDCASWQLPGFGTCPVVLRPMW